MGGETICPPPMDLRPSADGSAVRTSLVASGGFAAGSQRAYSLGGCAMGQTDGRIALFQNSSRAGGIMIIKGPCSRVLCPCLQPVNTGSGVVVVCSRGRSH